MNPSIKFIYFDIGGVLIQDFSKTNKWQELLDDLGLVGEIRQTFTNIFMSFEHDICAGNDIGKFVMRAEKELNVVFPENYDMTAAIVAKFESNPEFWSFVRRCRERFQTGLLTNMYIDMLNQIHERELMPRVEWNVVVDSSIVKASKPNEKIFEVAESRVTCKPEEILFIENTQRHVDVATARGWQTFLYNIREKEKMNQELETLLFLDSSITI